MPEIDKLEVEVKIEDKKIKEAGNKEKKKRKLSYKRELEIKIEELQSKNDQLLRTMADLDNSYKRKMRDFEGDVKYANEGLIKEILSVIDDLERSLSASDKNGDCDASYAGIEIIYSKFIELLKRQGLEAIESEGKSFDINYHEALMERNDPEKPPETVLEELQKGYMYRNKVIRYAKVVVNQDKKE